MIRVESFRPYHVDLMRAQGVQSAQLREISNVPATYATVPRGPAASVFSGDRIVLLGGIAEQSPTRGMCWALLSEEAAAHMQPLHYMVKRFIGMRAWDRLEASVEEVFTQGCRWVELLGFEFEGRMKKYGMNGETHLRYARVS